MRTFSSPSADGQLFFWETRQTGFWKYTRTTVYNSSENNYAEDRLLFIAREGRGGDFGLVTIKFTWSPIKLCSSLMILAYWQLISS